MIFKDIYGRKILKASADRNHVFLILYFDNNKNIKRVSVKNYCFCSDFSYCFEFKTTSTKYNIRYYDLKQPIRKIEYLVREKELDLFLIKRNQKSSKYVPKNIEHTKDLITTLINNRLHILCI